MLERHYSLDEYRFMLAAPVAKACADDPELGRLTIGGYNKVIEETILSLYGMGFEIVDTVPLEIEEAESI